MNRFFTKWWEIPLYVACGGVGIYASLAYRDYADAQKARAFTPDRPVGTRWAEANALLPPGHTIYADDHGEWVTIVVHGNYVLCQWLYPEKRWRLTPLAHRPAPVVDLEEANKNGAASYITRDRRKS